MTRKFWFLGVGRTSPLSHLFIDNATLGNWIYNLHRRTFAFWSSENSQSVILMNPMLILRQNEWKILDAKSSQNVHSTYLCTWWYIPSIILHTYMGSEYAFCIVINLQCNSLVYKPKHGKLFLLCLPLSYYSLLTLLSHRSLMLLWQIFAHSSLKWITLSHSHCFMVDEQYGSLFYANGNCLGPGKVQLHPLNY